MFDAEAALVTPTLSDGFVRTGTVEEVLHEAGRAWIRCDSAPHEPALAAEIATWGDGSPASGDRVVLAGHASGEAFVIGVLGRKHRQREQQVDRRITLSDGAAVRISGDPPTQKIGRAHV